MSLRFPEDVKQILKRKYKNNHHLWIGTPSALSLKISLGTFTEKEVLLQGQNFYRWVEFWKTKFPGELIWKEYNWKVLGRQSLPSTLVLTNPRDIALWIDEIEHWESFDQLKRVLPNEFSQISLKLLNQIHIAYGHQISELNKLLRVVTWLLKNKNSNLYTRQLPVEGIDSKWVENNTDIITKVLIEINPQEKRTNDFYSISGLRSAPICIRVRILDPKLAAKISGVSDLSITHDELIKLDLGARRVLLTENLQSGLSLGFLPETVVIMGMGNAVSLLADIPWIESSEIYYWGDIDTFGLAILNQLRLYKPACKSILMDKKTLLDNITFRSEEIKQHTSEELVNLTQLEKEVFAGLRSHLWGQNLRLEQERIPWEYAWSVIQKIIS